MVEDHKKVLRETEAELARRWQESFASTVQFCGGMERWHTVCRVRKANDRSWRARPNHQRRALRAYVAYKIGESIPAIGTNETEKLVADLDPALIALANSVSLAEAHKIVSWRNGTTRQLEKLRARGRRLLATYPALHLDQMEAGPPRDLNPPDDRPRSVNEIERVAPGTAPGTAAHRDALVAAALRGDLDYRLLPHHVVAEIVAVLEALNQQRLARSHRPAVAPPIDPAEDIEVIEAAFGGLESAAYFAALAATLGSARAALAALSSPTSPPPTDWRV